jgi:hypothetical protein
MRTVLSFMYYKSYICYFYIQLEIHVHAEIWGGNVPSGGTGGVKIRLFLGKKVFMVWFPGLEIQTISNVYKWPYMRPYCDTCTKNDLKRHVW